METKLFGKIAYADSIEDLMTSICVLDFDKSFSSRFWRGQANIDWPIDTTSFRRARRSQDSWTKDIFQRAIASDRWMLERARHLGFGFSDGKELTDWELISKLRHYGASSCLLDVTKNPLVALWFACSSEPKASAIISGLHCDSVGGSEGYSNLGDYFEEIKEANSLKHPVLYDPKSVSLRVASQASCFLFGGGSKSKMGSMIYEEELESYTFIGIQAELKQKVIKTLDQVFFINRSTLFPDIEGFALSNSPDFDISSNHRW